MTTIGNKHVARVGHEFAAAMTADTPIIEIAKMVSRLANALDEQTTLVEVLSEQQSISAAITDIIAERQRQQNVEGWTLEHDDQHGDFELAIAAACYAQNVADFAGAYYQLGISGEVFDWTNAPEPEVWPWALSWWKPTNPRRDLVKAGALIAAEIERLDRATGGEVQS